MGRTIRTCSFLAALTLAFAASAQDYPNRAVKVIATEAGGSTDLVARSIGQKLAERWGQAVVVENRGGASGIIGAELAARAPADGYTLFIGHTGTLAINPAVYKSLPYDPVRDYAPVTLVLATPLVVVAHPSFDARTTKELIELLRAKPGEIPYGSRSAFSPAVRSAPEACGRLIQDEIRKWGAVVRAAAIKPD